MADEDMPRLGRIRTELLELASLTSYEEDKVGIVLHIASSDMSRCLIQMSRVWAQGGGALKSSDIAPVDHSG